MLGSDAKRIGVAVRLTFYIADVFAEEKYAGNQLIGPQAHVIDDVTAYGKRFADSYNLG